MTRQKGRRKSLTWSSTDPGAGATPASPAVWPPATLGTGVPKSPRGTITTAVPPPPPPDAEPAKLGALPGAPRAAVELTRAIPPTFPWDMLALGGHAWPVRLGRAVGGPLAAEEPDGSGGSPLAMAAAAGEKVRDGLERKRGLEASRLPAAGCGGGGGGGKPL